MVYFASYLVLAPAVLLGIVVAVLLIEVAASVALARVQTVVRTRTDSDGRVAVVVPAHNESRGLLPTLADIKAQLRAGDRLVVVADNCSDDTAAVAAAAGAQVVERHDPERIGKGFALDWGIRYLNDDPPGIVVIVDADCRLSGGAIDALAATCGATNRPAQALYLMTAPATSQVDHRVAEFAWRLKNWIRPLGLGALGLPCQLAGTGMAFPWKAVRDANLATESVVEDLKLGLELTSAGFSPAFCPAARVTSQFAESVEGAGTQRKRWEAGHIAMILSAVPRLIGHALTSRNWHLLALALDAAVPPLSLLVLLVAGMVVLAVLSALAGLSSAALVVSVTSLAALLLAISLAWMKCGRDILPVRSIFLLLAYVVGKIGLYRSILFKRAQHRWIRTDREKSG